MKKEIKLQRALKLTAFVENDKKYAFRRLYKAVQDALLNHDIIGFSRIKGVESFGSGCVIHSLSN